MAVPPAPGAVTPPGTAETDETPRSATFRLVLLIALVLLLLASAGTMIWLLADRRDEAADVQSEREAVMSQSRQFVLRLNTYGPDDLDDEGHLTAYGDLVGEVITPKFAADFEESGLPIAEQTVTQAGYARAAEVFGLGVQSIDDDSAIVLVAAGLSGSYDDPKHPGDETKRISAGEDVLRWQVELVRTDGEWLVDDYAPVTGEGE